MKKGILVFITVLTTLSLMAFGIINWSDANEKSSDTKVAPSAVFNPFNPYSFNTEFEFVYKVESRFMTRITKEDLLNAETIIDILPEKETRIREAYEGAIVAIVNRSGRYVESKLAQDEVLSIEQLEMLKSADYSTDIHITVKTKRKISRLCLTIMT